MTNLENVCSSQRTLPMRTMNTKSIKNYTEWCSQNTKRFVLGPRELTDGGRSQPDGEKLQLRSDAVFCRAAVSLKALQEGHDMHTHSK